MYMLLYCFFISFYNFIYVFSFKDKKMHLLKKNTYYHGVIFVVFFQLKVDIVYFYGFGAVPHLIFYHICKIILSVPQACLGNENGRKVSRRMHYFKNTYLHIHSRLLPDYSRPKSRRHNLLVYTRHRDTWIHYNRTQLKKKPNNVWLKHNIIYFFNIFSNITGLTNSYHPSCYRHISDRNIYTTSLLLISLVLLS